MTTVEKFIQLDTENVNFVVQMEEFFSLAEREIKEQNSTDFNTIEFIVRAGKHLLREYAQSSWNAKEELRKCIEPAA